MSDVAFAQTNVVGRNGSSGNKHLAPLGNARTETGSNVVHGARNNRRAFKQTSFLRSFRSHFSNDVGAVKNWRKFGAVDAATVEQHIGVFAGFGIAELGKPVILSTGMNDISSIAKSVAILRSRNIPYALLHTTNIYPTPPHLVRLESVRELQTELEDAVVGLSDHTTSNHACFGAVALGASILERHFTDSMSRDGPDIVCSMDSNEAQDLIKGATELLLSLVESELINNFNMTPSIHKLLNLLTSKVQKAAKHETNKPQGSQETETGVPEKMTRFARYIPNKNEK